ncbi:tRNA-(ms(2)io(6)a)-hydrolase(tRNA hydroxylase) [Legionella londiniensis]|uniref:Hydroxylase for synthesis of 2-methylthio-cis-ribozeatin in tRNA n=2 Tax=Legionella londiniensis TaxID=45068 RepID=A0A0W0VMN9_9GAMM|nr:tRNA-(ms[2]io[6]A)-hydroxylase [Legionella londiniensis]KTD21299.1 hydroxylase for synthesis of 2-methylthio-cis-ribozeatin in tRNA [Legionella londiniensis]STX93325.1 tRNA-(ms(2)io(6)a)-hydrolase(tRNA hydroxylase) [Legionella londiniensis]
MKETKEIDELLQFLRIPSPREWLSHAVLQLPLLLVDHAHCERKAAATAVNFISKYPEKTDLVAVMSPLAREELLHFEKVVALLKARNIAFTALKPCSYMLRLHQEVAVNGTNERLCDQLIVGAIIEARSCERFYALSSLINDSDLARFYLTLARSEARHFRDYLRLSRLYGKNTDKRIEDFLNIENEHIYQIEEVFRFHSGIPKAVS